jgi:hypothetical protein
VFGLRRARSFQAFDPLREHGPRLAERAVKVLWNVSPPIRPLPLSPVIANLADREDALPAALAVRADNEHVPTAVEFAEIMKR